MNTALNNTKGSDWYPNYGVSIMQGYSDFQKIQNKIDNGVAPINALDITALFYLLNPYDQSQDADKTIYLDGAMDWVADYYHWESWQTRKLDRIRLIRNMATHDNCDRDFVPDEARLKAGVQEKLWLEEIESIIKNIQPSFQLEKYKHALAEQTKTAKIQNEYNPFANNIEEVESVRAEVKKVFHFDFFDAPLGTPLEGAAPWADCDVALENLPWPTLGNQTNTKQPDSSQGVNKVFKWLNKNR